VDHFLRMGKKRENRFGFKTGMSSNRNSADAKRNALREGINFKRGSWLEGERTTSPQSPHKRETHCCFGRARGIWHGKGTETRGGGWNNTGTFL